MTDYQKYQLQWMMDHDCSIDDLITELNRCQRWNGYENKDTIKSIYNEWELNVGFSGMIWACEKEWEENEQMYL